MVNLCRAVNTLPIVDVVEADSAAAVVDSIVVAAVVDRLPSTKTKVDKNSEAGVDIDLAVAERSAADSVDVAADAAVAVLEAAEV